MSMHMVVYLPWLCWFQASLMCVKPAEACLKPGICSVWSSRLSLVKSRKSCSNKFRSTDFIST